MIEIVEFIIGLIILGMMIYILYQSLGKTRIEYISLDEAYFEPGDVIFSEEKAVGQILDYPIEQFGQFQYKIDVYP